MLIIDRERLQNYLLSRLEDDELELPAGVTIEELTDQFSAYLEVDLYDWLSENYRSFLRDKDWP